MKAKYEQELKSLFENFYRADWMTDKNWNEFENSLLRELKTDYEKLSDLIEVGIQNGYSLEVQFELLEKQFDFSQLI